ncbi:MAG: type II toxin-antitoxin system Phd/YefM family antitoxin [Ardenticatenia bacterium]|nr:type II toxin-antitoxin system Phd/YefM family antitoxin [Ardenticatenia bacterium]
MEPKTISVTELRLSAAEILGAARFGGQHFIVQRFGRPMVAIVGVEEYKELMRAWQGRDENPSPVSRDLSFE